MSYNLTGVPTVPNGAIVLPGAMLGGQPIRLGESCANSFDPRTGSGLKRPVGSILTRQNGQVAFQKTGTADTAWSLVAAGGSSFTTALTVAVTDDNTNVPSNLVTIRHLSTGTPAPGFGSTISFDLETGGGGAAKTVFTDTVKLTTATSGAEEVIRTFGAMTAGVLQPLASFLFGNGSNSAQELLLGDPAQQTGFRAFASPNQSIMVASGQNIVRASAGLLAIDTSRFEETKGAAVASAGTVTLGTDGNYFLITGATTINGITTSGWQAGSRIFIELQTLGITVTNNSGAPGGGAVAIKTRTGANLVTAKASYLLELVYNGTFWLQPD